MDMKRLKRDYLNLTRAQNIVSTALGVIVALFVFAVLTDFQIPLVSGIESAFFILAIVGFSICALGISHSIKARGFLHPLNIVGVVLGVLALPLFFFTDVFGVKILLFDIGYRTAFIILAAIIFSKWVLARLGNLIE